ncbi:hypothetical protein [Faecalibacillus intestinalis]|uniref:hypothetical protein n=1 Tax=Faecalibacillus intestinalis TaxID=1982626 RepID=UPI0022E49BAC|nr:hypothetical protein [Faecalibacillus intestinalis]
MDYGLKQALKVVVALACGTGVTAASISINDKNSETALTNKRFGQWWTTYPTDKILKALLEKGKNATEYIE